jgi:RecA-family ATPase
MLDDSFSVPPGLVEVDLKPESEDSALERAAINWTALGGKVPPPRRFAWDPWLPAGKVALLNGFGAVGKSLLAQQLATAYALGRALFGGETEGRPVLMIAAEDDHDETWRRQIEICERFGISPDEVNNLTIVPDCGLADMTLARVQPDGRIDTTPLWDDLWRMIDKRRPGPVVLDNAALLFAVNENDRMHVTRCVGLLRSLCYHFNTTVLLLCHNNKVGDFSGSTAWENAARARLALARNEGGETVTLSRPKANYAGNGDITIRWERGSFRCEDEHGMTDAERLDAKIAQREHADVFLQALDTLNAQGRNVSHSPNARNYAPKVMAEHRLCGTLTKQQIKGAMELLFSECRIVANAEVGRNEQRRQKIFGIARADVEIDGGEENQL